MLGRSKFVRFGLVSLLGREADSKSRKGGHVERIYFQRREYRDDWIKRECSVFVYDSQLLKLPDKPPQWPTLRIHWYTRASCCGFNEKETWSRVFLERPPPSSFNGERITFWTETGTTTEDGVVRFFDSRACTEFLLSLSILRGTGNGLRVAIK